MGTLPELLLAWAPLVAVVVLWVVMRRGYGRQVGESLALSRESIELQKRIVSCLEDIRAELKGASTVKGS